MEHKGPLYLLLAALGKIMTWMQDVSIKEVGAWVTVIGGTLAAIHYAIIIYEKLFKRKKTIS